jgi:hypothetical protein
MFSFRLVMGIYVLEDENNIWSKAYAVVVYLVSCLLSMRS